MVEVYEQYLEFSPPVQVRRRVEMLLRRVRSSHLAGLSSVVLTNRSALSRDERRQKVWCRGKQARLSDSSAYYQRAHANNPAWIRVIVDNVFADVPKWAMRVPVIPTMLLAQVLYHELGHHIHATSHPQHREKEDVADEWSTRLTRRLVSERYWYLVPPMGVILPPLYWLMKRRSRSRP